MDKQYAFAVILIILGVGLVYDKEIAEEGLGFGVGLIAMGSVWVAIRLVKELKK